jgi:hypothetical protein
VLAQLRLIQLFEAEKRITQAAILLRQYEHLQYIYTCIKGHRDDAGPSGIVLGAPKASCFADMVANLPAVLLVANE